MHQQEGVRNPYAILWVTSLGLLLLLTNATSVNVALPELSRDFGTSTGLSDWFLLAFMLCNTASILVFGRISDMFGRRTIYLAGMSVFVVASVVAAVAPSAGVFIACRAVQGVSAATIVSNSTAIVADAFPPARLAQAMSLNLTAATIGNTIGPAVGGLLVTHFGWRSVFLINAPFGVAAVLFGLRLLPRGTAHGSRGRFDLPGAVLSALGLGLMLYAVNRISDAGVRDLHVIACGLAGVALLTLFVAVETRVPAPLVNVALVNSLPRAAAYVAAFWQSYARAAANVLIVLQLQVVGGRTAAEAGLILMVMMLALLVSTIAAGRLALTFTPRSTSAVGGAMLVASLTGFALSASSSSLALASVWLVLCGGGIGLFTGPNTTAIMSGVPAEHRTVANAIRSMLFNSAQAVATAVSLLVVASSGISDYAVHSSSPEVVRAFAIAFWIGAAGAAVSMVCAVVRGGPWRTDRSGERV
ncbi:MAG: MFS transporter [Nocardioides sp.]|uniref:MFS transporter n=1 Tax=Nocardioides sp. TaxID=35761 RepID=UPI0039E4956B